MRNKKALSLFLSTAMILSLCQFPALAGAEELTDLSPDTGIEEIVIDEDDAASDSALADLWDGLEIEEAPEVMEAQPEEETDDLLSDGEADEEELPLAEDAAEGEFTGYVLMNIPYEKFYASEGIPGVDAVTSATKNKPRTGTLAGGSYHVNADGTDISGIIYPVYVKDPEILSSYKQITDEDSVTITVTNRGQESMTTYAGKDALFEAPSYAYYTLTEKPARYKTLNADGTFSAVSGRAATVEGVTGEVTLQARHATVEIALSGTTGIEKGDAVSAVVLTDNDGNKYGLRHIANLWRATEIGWNNEFNLRGKTITNIRYYTQSAVTDYPVSIEVGKLFSDVNDASLPYYNAVYWALDKGIAAGWDDNTFRPAVTINRAAVVTFLWRLAGKPEASAPAAFKDMPSNEEFAKAISWAVEQGIVTGWTEDNTFRPWKICNRAAIITFIWRYAGRPEAAAGASFQDMTKNEEFNKAISWAVEKGIASGTTDTTFTPWGLCQRADVVSFLYSYSKLR